MDGDTTNWKEELVNRYPHLYKDSSVLQVNRGWLTLIETLSASIQHHIDCQKRNLSPDEEKALQVTAIQVKEKFGGLRFYYSGGDQAVRGMVTLAESLSYKTCEDCGVPGKARQDGWIRTLCDVCHENRARR